MKLIVKMTEMSTYRLYATHDCGVFDTEYLLTSLLVGFPTMNWDHDGRNHQ